MFRLKNVDKIFKNQIQSNELLRTLFEEYHAILAGGAALSFFQGIDLNKHLKRHRTADLDLYFRNEKDYNRAVNFAIKYSNKDQFWVDKSVTGLCYNIHQSNDYYEISSIDSCKIQLVGCVFGRPEEIVSSFDFRNLEVCYFFENEKYNMLYSNSTSGDVIDVRHSESPFLMYRVFKYLKYRGFSGITENSRTHITDWIIKASSGYYSDNRDRCPTIYVDLLNNEPFKEMLQNKSIITDDDLALLIGKVKEDILESMDSWTTSGYSRRTFRKVGTRDLVVEQINQRSENENHKEVS